MASLELSPPQVIFLDAVGTLFGVQGSVGEIYGQLAQRFGVQVDPALLNRAFFESFRHAPPIAFPGVVATDIPAREYAWWQAIATETFQRAGVYQRFTAFPDFFAHLYAHFATAAPWVVYPDTIRFLQYWRDRKVELGILSNFDSRIYAVLDVLGLTNYFTSITISTEAGAAKPSQRIFEVAIAKHRCAPEQAWHIGDSYREDYEGAKSANLRGIWLRRADQTIPTPSPEVLEAESVG